MSKQSKYAIMENENKAVKKATQDGNRIREIMAHLGCSREEAIDLIMCDKEIDGGADWFELDTEEAKEALKQAHAKMGTRKRKQTSPRPRKVDDVKKGLMQGFIDYLETQGANVQPMKTEAAIDFDLGGDEYTIKLVKHRKPKAE